MKPVYRIARLRALDQEMHTVRSKNDPYIALLEINPEPYNTKTAAEEVVSDLIEEPNLEGQQFMILPMYSNRIEAQDSEQEPKKTTKRKQTKKKTEQAAPAQSPNPPASNPEEEATGAPGANPEARIPFEKSIQVIQSNIPEGFAKMKPKQLSELLTKSAKQKWWKDASKSLGLEKKKAEMCMGVAMVYEYERLTLPQGTLTTWDVAKAVIHQNWSDIELNNFKLEPKLKVPAMALRQFSEQIMAKPDKQPWHNQQEFINGLFVTAFDFSGYTQVITE